MERYFINWIPFVIGVALVLLALPWLGVIALMVFVLAAFAGLAALAWGIVFVPYTLGRAISLRLRSGRDVRTPSTSEPLAERTDGGA